MKNKKKIVLTEKEKRVVQKDMTKGEPKYQSWSKEERDIWASAVVKSLFNIKK